MRGGWWCWHGSWWAVHFCVDGWVSLGVHIDFKRRRTGREGIRYGPYADFHVGCVILSLGVNPVYATEIAASTFRTGVRAG